MRDAGQLDRFKVLRDMSMFIGFADSADETLRRAYRSYHDEQSDAFPALVSEKLEILEHFDVPGMEHAVAICNWGRSGSLLLASYLDAHDDVVMLPMTAGCGIYPFFHEYQSLSVWEKLVAYPAFADQFTAKRFPQGFPPFFGDDFSVGPADYYAAVHALFMAYGERPSVSCDRRRTFFQFLHAAYAVAIGRRLGKRRPLIVYAQHVADADLSGDFVDDFPSGRFIHTIRDPVSTLDSWFDHVSLTSTDYSLIPHPGYIKTALDTLSIPLHERDKPLPRMGERTRAVRFEDLHLTLENTMRDVANWLGIEYRQSLLESTFNGVPWFVESGGATWTGPNPTNARRRSRNLGLVDRLLMFALFHANFVAWRYPSPRIFRSKLVRLTTIAALWLVPMKMEMLTARTVMQLQVVPCLRRGRIAFACRAILRLFACRWAMMQLIATGKRARSGDERRVLALLHIQS